MEGCFGSRCNPISHNREGAKVAGIASGMRGVRVHANWAKKENAFIDWNTNEVGIGANPDACLAAHEELAVLKIGERL